MWERRRGLAQRPQKSGQEHPKIHSRGCLISRTGAPQNSGQDNPKIQGRTPKIRPGRPQKSGQEPLNPWGRGTPKPGRRHVSPLGHPTPSGVNPRIGVLGSHLVPAPTVTLPLSVLRAPQPQPHLPRILGCSPHPLRALNPQTRLLGSHLAVAPVAALPLLLLRAPRPPSPPSPLGPTCPPPSPQPPFELNPQIRVWGSHLGADFPSRAGTAAHRDVPPLRPHCPQTRPCPSPCPPSGPNPQIPVLGVPPCCSSCRPTPSRAGAGPGAARPGCPGAAPAAARPSSRPPRTPGPACAAPAPPRCSPRSPRS